MPKLSIGKKIRALRKARVPKMTQANLADAVGVELATIFRWESDVSEPRPHRLSKLAEIFDVTPDYFLTDDIPKNPTVDHLLGAMRELHRENRDLKIMLQKPIDTSAVISSRVRELEAEVARLQKASAVVPHMSADDLDLMVKIFEHAPRDFLEGIPYLKDIHFAAMMDVAPRIYAVGYDSDTENGSGKSSSDRRAKR